MSLRQMFQGSIVKPGFNPLAAPTATTTYYLYSMGLNNVGQLGLNNTTYYSSPKQVGSLGTWAVVSAAGSSSIGVSLGGALWVWGNSTYGQLGLNNTTTYLSPTQVGSLANWSKVSMSFNASTMAVKTDGTLWTWGRNNFGQLGLGNTTDYSSPKQVGALTGWLNVCSSYGSSFALKTNGTLWSWGKNNYGQLGLGNTTYVSSPVQVGALTTWSQVSAQGQTTLALKTDGTLWAWGRGDIGGLGLGNETSYSSPTQVGALTNWSWIAGGLLRGLATKTDGTLWAWGYNNEGVLGIGNVTNYSSPKQVGALTNWSKVYAQTDNTYRTLAVKTNGTLWGWGNNSYGPLGFGNTTTYSSPKQVGAQTDWGQGANAVAMGQNFSLASRV